MPAEQTNSCIDQLICERQTQLKILQKAVSLLLFMVNGYLISRTTKMLNCAKRLNLEIWLAILTT